MKCKSHTRAIRSVIHIGVLEQHVSRETRSKLILQLMGQWFYVVDTELRSETLLAAYKAMEKAK